MRERGFDGPADFRLEVVAGASALGRAGGLPQTSGHGWAVGLDQICIATGVGKSPTSLVVSAKTPCTGTVNPCDSVADRDRAFGERAVAGSVPDDEVEARVWRPLDRVRDSRR